MRVTDRMIYDNASLWTGNARSRVEAATEAASTGLRVLHPGDDPAAAGQVGVHQQAQARAEAIGKAVQTASDELNSADGALGAVGNAVARARELAVQLSTNIYTAAQRAAASTEVIALLSEAIAALNVKVGNRYLFGGSKDSQPPFDSTGAYLGDTLVRRVEAAPGLLQDASVRADVAAKGAGGGVDLLATLQSLATALAANDISGVQGTLDGLGRGTAQIAGARVAAGADQSALDAAHSVALAASTSEKSAVSRLEDADLVASATELQLAQRALEAALQASMASFRLSLATTK